MHKGFSNKIRIMSVLSDSLSQDLLTINRRYFSFKQVIWYCTNDKMSVGEEGKAKQMDNNKNNGLSSNI